MISKQHIFSSTESRWAAAGRRRQKMELESQIPEDISPPQTPPRIDEITYEIPDFYNNDAYSLNEEQQTTLRTISVSITELNRRNQVRSL